MARDCISFHYYYRIDAHTWFGGDDGGGDGALWRFDIIRKRGKHIYNNLMATSHVTVKMYFNIHDIKRKRSRHTAYHIEHCAVSPCGCGYSEHRPMLSLLLLLLS